MAAVVAAPGLLLQKGGSSRGDHAELAAMAAPLLLPSRQSCRPGCCGQAPLLCLLCLRLVAA